MTIALDPARLARLVWSFDSHHTLEIMPDGNLYLVRLFKAKAPEELEAALRCCRTGDRVTIERYAGHCHLVLRRPFPQLFDTEQ